MHAVEAGLTASQAFVVSETQQVMQVQKEGGLSPLGIKASKISCGRDFCLAYNLNLNLVLE